MTYSFSKHALGICLLLSSIGFLLPLQAQNSARLSLAEGGLVDLSLPPDVYISQLPSVHLSQASNSRNEKVDLDWSLTIQGNVAIRGQVRGYVVRPGNSVITLNPGISSLEQFDIPATSNATQGVFCVVEKGSGEQQCKTISLISPGVLPPRLVYPFDRDTVTTSHPVFSWLPAFYSNQAGITYSILIVERFDYQSKEAALTTNPPTLREAEIRQPIFPYPAFAEELDTTKVYVWQVRAYTREGTRYLGSSEIWQFSFPRVEVQEPEEDAPDYYADLSQGRWSGLFIAQSRIALKYDDGRVGAIHATINLEAGKQMVIPMEKIAETGRGRLVVDLGGLGLKNKENRNCKVIGRPSMKPWKTLP